MLSVFTVTLSSGVRQKLSLIKRLDERDRMRYIADAALKKAIAQIKKEEHKGYDTLKDAWSNDASRFKDIPIEDGTFSIVYPYVDEVSGDTQSRYGLIDEESKININTANRKIMERLFQILLSVSDTEAQGLAASIIDWRDGDSLLSIPLGSAEDAYYKGLSHPYEAKDAGFESLEELLLVKGVAQDILEKIKKYITVYGEARVNINTASKTVLASLGLHERIINAILLFRAGEDGSRGTFDDNVFDAALSITQRLSQRYQLNEAEAAELTVISERYLTTYSSAFMVEAVAQLQNRKNSLRVVSVIDRQGKILYWQEP
jgi:type II secretory pathway component PulK